MSNISVFNIWTKVLNSSQDLQLNDRDFQTAGALTLKALADNANDVTGIFEHRCAGTALMHHNLTCTYAELMCSLQFSHQNTYWLLLMSFAARLLSVVIVRSHEYF